MTDEEITKIIFAAFDTALEQIDFHKLYKEQLELIDINSMFKGDFPNKPTKEQMALITAVAKQYFIATIRAIITLRQDGIL